VKNAGVYLLEIFRGQFTNFKHIMFVLEFLFDYKILNAVQKQICCVSGISLHSTVSFKCYGAGLE
jgi:hypothetical protein